MRWGGQAGWLFAPPRSASGSGNGNDVKLNNPGGRWLVEEADDVAMPRNFGEALVRVGQVSPGSAEGVMRVASSEEV
jgi:hypothetical protein